MLIDQAFIKLHSELPRQGIGSDWCTREAIGRLPPLRKPPAVIDLGCGSGRQTIVLARHFRSQIHAVDLCPQFLDQLRDTAEAAGVTDLIKPRQEDFAKLPDPDASFDLIWSEGSACVLGLEQSLAQWRRLMRPRGVIVVSLCTWLTDSPPAEAQSFWQRLCPTMTDLDGNIAIARQAGLSIFDHFTLPRSTCWDEYYAPLHRQIVALQSEAGHDPDLAGQIAAAQQEISLFQRHGDSYGYIFYLMRQA